MGLTLGRLDDPVILFRAEEQPAPWLAAGPRMERLLLVGPLSATEGDHNSLFRPDYLAINAERIWSEFEASISQPA